MPSKKKNELQSSTRRYREEWEKDKEFRGWLCRAPSYLDKPDYAYCKWCKAALRPHKSDLTAHANTGGHKQRGQTIISHVQKKIDEYGAVKMSDEMKINDIRLVLHAAIHSSMNGIDHLTEMLKECGKGSLLGNLKLHRTKCSKLILNVISPAFLKELIDDIGDQDYSLIVDESTDVSTLKYMAYCVRYFSVKHNKIITNFLGFSEVAGTTANELYKIVKEFLLETGLPIQQLIGLGTDGASNLCGENHSLYTLLREDVPGLQLIKCTCHSIDLCANKAWDELPSNLSFILREIYNWFAHSALRQSMYKDSFVRNNSGAKPAKFVSLSTTRWLVAYTANNVIVKQWVDLKSFFTSVAKSAVNKCYTARTLAAMLSDDVNLLYLIFVDGILKDVYELNLAFQKKDADVTKLYCELRVLIMSLARRIFKPTFLKPLDGSRKTSGEMLHQADLNAVQHAIDKVNDEFGNSLLPVDSMDLGDTFDEIAGKKRVSDANMRMIKERCAAYIVRLCKELIQRLPRNLRAIENMRYFTPSVCLSQANIPVKNLPWDLAGDGVERTEIESQWRRLQTLRLSDISSDFKEDISTVDFWIAVWNMKNVNGERTFKNLALFALRALSLPISNAYVERVFSFMSAIKTKVRNRMLMPMLVALIRIRIYMNVFGHCCKNYVPTKDMLNRFNKTMYNANLAEQINKDNDDLLEAFEIFETTMQAMGPGLQ